MAEGGNIRKGPTGVGVRVQEAMKVGPLKVDAVAAQVRGETPQGGRDEGWGARAFIVNDILPVSVWGGGGCKLCKDTWVFGVCWGNIWVFMGRGCGPGREAVKGN